MTRESLNNVLDIIQADGNEFAVSTTALAVAYDYAVEEALQKLEKAIKFYFKAKITGAELQEQDLILEHNADIMQLIQNTLSELQYKEV